MRISSEISAYDRDIPLGEIGRIERGFDLLGYHFSPAWLAAAKQTIANLIEKAFRLYEQKRRAVSTVPPLEIYFRLWTRWADSGIIVVMVHGDRFPSGQSLAY